MTEGIQTRTLLFTNGSQPGSKVPHVSMSDMELSVAGEEGEPSDDYEEDDDDDAEGEAATGRETAPPKPPFPPQGGSRGEKGGGGGGGGGGRRAHEHRRMVDITRDKPVKVTVRVVVPVRDHPKFNFVGKLLGPKGNSLKRLQEDSMTKMAILGRGSMKDKQKEEELRSSGDPKFSHLRDDLHVEITAFAPPAEAHARIAYALADVRRFLVPDYNDDIRQEQMWEMQILKERPEDAAAAADGSGIHLLGTGTPVTPPVAETPSPGHSNGSQSPRTPPSTVPEPPAAPALLPPRHAALGGVAGRATPVLGTVNGRKRPLFPGSSRPSLSPTKRTVMSILARARAAHAKHVPGYRVEG